MGGGGPKPPDPKDTAAAQTQSSISTAIANQLLQGNQVTPWGSQTVSQTGTNQWTDPTSGKTYDLPQMTATTTLSPAQQRLFDSQTANSQRIANVGGRQIIQLGSILKKNPVTAPDLAKIGAGPKLANTFGNAGEITKTYGANDYSADRSKVEQALMSRMNPMLQQNRDRMTAQLANQGIKVGTEAYDREMANLGQNENDAMMQAILAGGQEQSRLTGLEGARAAFENSAQQQSYNQLLGRAQFGNDANQQMRDDQFARTGFNNNVAQQGFNNTQQMRSGAINEANALRGGGHVQMPQFPGMQNPQIPNIDMGALIGQQYNGQMQNYNNRQGMLGGLFTAGASMLPWIASLSDERTKTEIEPLGEMDVGGAEPVGVYRYEYKHDPGTKHIGTMAQEVQKVRPDAVVPMGKYLGVNYRKLVA